MKKHVLTLLTLLLICGVSIAQEGKPSVKIFSNFNYDMSAEDGEEAYKEFEVKRAYLGYSYKFNDEFSTKVTFSSSIWINACAKFSSDRFLFPKDLLNSSYVMKPL